MNRDIDIYHIYLGANVIVKRHGENARLHATMRANAMLKAGDLDAHAVWKRIRRAIEELQRVEPKSSEAMHY